MNAVVMNAAEAYAQCEQITWEQARNFAYGIRLLPPEKRHALAAVYAYARRIDDIGDGDLAPADPHSPNVRLPRRLISWTRARRHVLRTPISRNMSKTGPLSRLANPF